MGSQATREKMMDVMRGRCSSSLCKIIEEAVRLPFLVPNMEKRYFLEEIKALFADFFDNADIAGHSLGFSQKDNLDDSCRNGDPLCSWTGRQHNRCDKFL
ncbi:hypothetical protein SDC9_151171 [bioreactor metagenome]|uniref:Uncharacterized protein n=1 Tax=bioreactor metagenome TaxID=1076179 RepID=A0A645ER62_9ZZZZ